MPEENVDFLRQAYKAFNHAVQTGGMAAGAPWMREYLDPRIEWRLAEGALDTETFRGYEGVMRLFDRWLEAWDEWSLEPEEFIDAGVSWVVLDRIRGRGKGSGVPVEVPYAHVFKFREGKIVQIQDYPNKEAALKAAGLSE
jgi:ketosteroid isomerase-like protein